MVKVARVEKLDGVTAVVVMEGDTPSEVTSQESKEMAYQERNKLGLSGAGISASSGPYPADYLDPNLDEEDLEAAKQTTGAKDKFRMDYKLWAGV